MSSHTHTLLRGGFPYLFTGILLPVLFLSGCNYAPKKVESLNPPIIKNLGNKEVGKEIDISGSGYPKAKVLIFLNGEYKNDAEVTENGSFSARVNLNKQGENTVNAKQQFGESLSDFSNGLTLNADIEAPPTETFKLETELPKSTNNSSLEIKGKANPGDFVVVNDKDETEVTKEGTFLYKYTLAEGDNEVNFRLKDLAGNTTDVIKSAKISLDSIPPRIETSLCSLWEKTQLKPTEEYACLDSGEWEDYLPIVSIPITGKIKGNIKSVTLDGKNIKWDENNEVYQRMDLYLRNGLNKFKMVAEDTSGNKSSKYLDINVVDANSKDAGGGDNGDFNCDCSKTCDELSCDEAQYQLNTCGCSARDADSDGTACDADCQ